MIFLAAPGDRARAEAERAPLLELTYNWDKEDYGSGRNFGHLAFEVDDIYAFCQRLPSTGRRETDTWPLSDHRTTSLSKSCKKDSRSASPGPQCPTLGHGELGSGAPAVDGGRAGPLWPQRPGGRAFSVRDYGGVAGCKLGPRPPGAIARLYDFNMDTGTGCFFTLRGDIGRQLTLRPTQYRVSRLSATGRVNNWRMPSR